MAAEVLSRAGEPFFTSEHGTTAILDLPAPAVEATR